jgi:hypothetical protein
MTHVLVPQRTDYRGQATPTFLDWLSNWQMRNPMRPPEQAEQEYIVQTTAVLNRLLRELKVLADKFDQIWGREIKQINHIHDMYIFQLKGQGEWDNQEVSNKIIGVIQDAGPDTHKILRPQHTDRYGHPPRPYNHWMMNWRRAGNPMSQLEIGEEQEYIPQQTRMLIQLEGELNRLVAQFEGIWGRDINIITFLGELPPCVSFELSVPGYNKDGWFWNNKRTQSSIIGIPHMDTYPL